MHTLIIVWTDGEKEEHEYQTEQEARKAGRGYEIAFGQQVAWYGVRRN